MDQWYRSVISGERIGAWPAILRLVFEVLSWGYGVIVGLRNLFYDRGLLRETRLVDKNGTHVPVISVGNVTTGGTGKTPTVIMLVRELQRMGRRPAVLTRGYGAPPSRGHGAAERGKSDEVLLIEHECPGVPVVVNADRVAGGREAVDRHNADVLVLDDGFQHRRLARDLNIVLIDATEPLGIPGVLPRGTWRELPHNLKRANMIMLTRCEQVSPELADLAAGLLTQWVSPRAIFQQRTAVTGLFDEAGNVVPLVAGIGSRRVAAFAGIANPQGFLHTVESLGMQVLTGCWFDDHHAYKVPEDFVKLAQRTASRGIEAWVTTQKDWVKLQGSVLPHPQGVKLWHVRIESRLSPHELELLRARLATLSAVSAARR